MESAAVTAAGCGSESTAHRLTRPIPATSQNQSAVIHDPIACCFAAFRPLCFLPPAAAEWMELWKSDPARLRIDWRVKFQ